MRFKKKKTSKKRGSKFCGYGRGAAHHKGAGNRGGRGRAGTGKRADTKKPSYWHLPVGRHGFTSKARLKIKAINIEDIQKNLNAWVAEGLVVKGSNGYDIELGKLGYNKLLGNGIVSEKLMILADFASKNAIEKVKEAGGEVKVLKNIVKKKKKSVGTSKQKLAEPEIQKSKISENKSFLGQKDKVLLVSESKTESFGKQNFSGKKKAEEVKAAAPESKAKGKGKAEKPESKPEESGE